MRDGSDVTEWPHGITKTAHWNRNAGATKLGQGKSRAVPTQCKFMQSRRGCARHGLEFLGKKVYFTGQVAAGYQNHPFWEEPFLTCLDSRSE
jgi:hypothetical protein